MVRGGADNMHCIHCLTDFGHGTLTIKYAAAARAITVEVESLKAYGINLQQICWSYELVIYLKFHFEANKKKLVSLFKEK